MKGERDMKEKGEKREEKGAKQERKYPTKPSHFSLYFHG